MALEINDSNFSEKTKAGNAVVDFYADWCGPCKMLSPAFEKVASEFPKVSFFKLNVDESQDSAMNFGVRSIPTVVFLKDGREVDRFLGLVPEDEIRRKVKSSFGM